MCSAAAVHLEYLTRGWNLNRLQTNWVVIEANGAYIGGLFFQELAGAPDVIAKCLPYVAQAALTQETAEGMHWEQSNQYHNEVLLKLAEIELLAKRNDRVLPAAIPAVVRRMAIAAARFRKPDGTQDNYGDSDREYLDDLLVLIEQITGVTLLDQHTVTVPNRLVLTHYGRVAPKPDPIKPMFDASYAFNEAGIYLFKDSQIQLHTRFKCGFLGHGHGHDDLLHVALFAHGEDILVDSGRYSYEDAHHHRLAFKSPQYHNTSMVDGIAINEHANCWDAKKVTHAVNAHAAFKPGLDFAEGGHLGYLDLPQALYTNRKVLYVKPDLFVIVDEFIGAGVHQYQQFYHFKRDELSLGSTDNTLVYHDREARPYYVTTFDSNMDAHGSYALSSQDVSDDYNEKHSAPMATYTVSGAAPLSICTFITLGGVPISITPVAVQNEYGSDRHSSNASAFKLGADRYLVINHYEDADSRRGYLVDGHQVYGRVALVTPTGIIRAY